MRKRLVIALFFVTLASNLLTPISNAATVKNGVNCSKPGTSMKVGTKIYRCAKNPYVKSSRLTWTLRGCLTAYAMWKDSREQYIDWVDLAKLAGPEGQKTMEDLQTSINDLERTMKEIACKRGA